MRPLPMLVNPRLSAVDWMRERTSSFRRPLPFVSVACAKRSAARPETNGEAIEVPLM